MVASDLAGRRVAIEVTDILPRIVEPFFTTKSDDAGTGPGLPVAKEIVESDRLRPQVSGTTFRFDLPMS